MCCLAFSISIPLKGQHILSSSAGDSIYSSQRSPVLVATTYLSTSSDTPIQVHWKVKRIALPDGWTLHSICDNVLCYLPPVPDESDMDTFRSGADSLLNKLEITVKTNGNYDSTGIIEMELSIPDSGYTRTVMYIFRSWKLGTEITSQPNVRLTTYSNTIVVSNPSKQLLHVRVVDLSGKIYLNKALENDLHHNLPPGMYIVIVEDTERKNFRITRKVVLNATP